MCVNHFCDDYCVVSIQLDEPLVVEEQSSAQGMVLAVLAVIGGVDQRPRLGGLVTHEEWGLATISRISLNAKVTLQCHEPGALKTCRISDVEAVSKIPGLGRSSQAVTFVSLY